MADRHTVLHPDFHPMVLAANARRASAARYQSGAGLRVDHNKHHPHMAESPHGFAYHLVRVHRDAVSPLARVRANSGK